MALKDWKKTIDNKNRLAYYKSKGGDSISLYRMTLNRGWIFGSSNVVKKFSNKTKAREFMESYMRKH